MRKLLLASVLGLGLAGGGAQAEVIFTLGNHPQPDEQNLFFEAADTVPGTHLTGEIDHSGVFVNFSSLFAKDPASLGGGSTGQTIVANGIGQADIVCATNCVNNGGGADSAQLTSLQITPSAGQGFHDFILNPTHGHGDMNVFVRDNLGNNFHFDLRQGQDFLTITTANNEAITLIQLSELATGTGAFGWSDLAQPRISGPCTLGTATCEPINTPEPAGIALLGAGLLGLGWAIRRRT